MNLGQKGNSVQRNTPYGIQTNPDIKQLARNLVEQAKKSGWDGITTKTITLHGNDPESSVDAVRKIIMSSTQPTASTNQNVMWLNITTLVFYRSTAYRSDTPGWEIVRTYFDLVSNMFREFSGGGDSGPIDGGSF